jgi:hypothetical protein
MKWFVDIKMKVNYAILHPHCDFPSDLGIIRLLLTKRRTKLWKFGSPASTGKNLTCLREG